MGRFKNILYKKMFKRTKKGFTLIELLVVIAIIGILASVVLASLNSARKKSRDARRVADIKQLQLALELYFDKNSNYPLTLDTLKTDGEIPAVANDPLTGAYNYAALGSGATCSSYHLGASLEENTNAALNSDSDVVAATVCTGGGTDFAGADTGKCKAADKGSYCYDVEP